MRFTPPPPPSRITIKRMTGERMELYRHILPPVSPIPVDFFPFPVEDSISRKSDIAEAVKCLCLNRSG